MTYKKRNFSISRPTPPREDPTSDEETADPTQDNVLLATQTSPQQEHVEEDSVVDTQPNVILEEDDESSYKVGRRRPAIKLIFTEEQEVMLGSWYRDNPILYDKGLRYYKDANLKSTLLEEKAKTMDPPITGS